MDVSQTPYRMGRSLWQWVKGAEHIASCAPSSEQRGYCGGCRLACVWIRYLLPLRKALCPACQKVLGRYEEGLPVEAWYALLKVR